MDTPALEGRIAFVFAMPIEIAPLVSRLSLTETQVGGVTMHEGSVDGRNVVAIVTGMGTDLATAGTRRLLDAVPVRWVLVVGITGALESETPIGHLVLPEVVVNSETGREFRPAPLAAGTPTGKMWTTNGLTTQQNDLAALRAQGVVSLDMETAAIAELCEARGIPWSVFRVISDRASDGTVDEEVFHLSNQDGTPNPAAIERYIAEHPERLPLLAQMAEDATLATHTAVDAAIEACRENPLMRFAVIGAGMAGILSAIKLTEAGLTDFTVYEKGDQVGGTWRENTYPGLACDVPSHLYSYSFALTPDWSRRFSPGPEIRAYFERVAREHHVVERVRFGDEVTGCTFTNGRWHLETASGHRDEVDVVIAATGVLHHPKYPDIEGLDTFGGATFHSARWNHDVTIDNARVGIIGTGSTAVQMVTALVARVAKLSLFQRTAQWIMPQDNPEYSDDEKATFRADPARLPELHSQLAEMFGIFANAVIDSDSPGIKMIEDACLANLENNVRDPELRELLRPDYRAACKRLIVSPDFYAAIQQPNAELVTEGIERVEPTGVRTRDGRLHELDVLVLATGFNADAFMRPMHVTGRDGRTLAEAWAERPNAYLSISIPEFPNFFMVNGPNGPVGNFSLIEVAELQFDYILQLVARLRSGECREISASREAMDEFEATRTAAAQKTVWVTGCRSWYLDDRGIPATWPWSFDRFRETMPRTTGRELRLPVICAKRPNPSKTGE